MGLFSKDTAFVGLIDATIKFLLTILPELGKRA
jgi:hypothetical protein